MMAFLPRASRTLSTARVYSALRSAYGVRPRMFPENPLGARASCRCQPRHGLGQTARHCVASTSQPSLPKIQTYPVRSDAIAATAAAATAAPVLRTDYHPWISNALLSLLSPDSRSHCRGIQEPAGTARIKQYCLSRVLQETEPGVGVFLSFGRLHVCLCVPSLRGRCIRTCSVGRYEDRKARTVSPQRGRGRMDGKRTTVSAQAAVRSLQSAEGSMTLASIPSQVALPLHSSHLLHCRAPPATTQHKHHKHTNLVCRLQGMHHTAHTARRETPTWLRPVSLARRLVDRSMANLCLMGAAQRCEVPPRISTCKTSPEFPCCQSAPAGRHLE